MLERATPAIRSDQPVLTSEFQRRFSPASGTLRKAYHAASWVIPYLTAVRAVSNSNFGYWHGMDAGGLMQRYIETGTGDGNLLYSIGNTCPTEERDRGCGTSGARKHR